MIINPGDIVVGDEDGLVAFPQAVAKDVLGMARNHEALEERVKAEIANGSPDQSWINNALSKAGLL
ncbi:4-hydroxy-4-methyl-2-oxoglutarate aldolase [compost metagenome]